MYDIKNILHYYYYNFMFYLFRCMHTAHTQSLRRLTAKNLIFDSQHIFIICIPKKTFYWELGD